jgi:hypothetical protein
MSLEQCLTLGIVLAGEPVVMPGRAVSLKDEMSVRPAEVRDHPTAREHKRHVDVRKLEATAADEVKHDVLELTPCGRGTLGHDPREVAHPPSRTQPANRFGEPAEIHAVQRQPLPHGTTKRSVVEERGEIDQRPGWGCDGDALMSRDIQPVEHERPMHENSRSAGLDRRQEAPLARGVRVAYRVDGPMDRMQAPVPHSHRDGVTRQSTLAQLIQGDNSPLLGRPKRNAHVGSDPGALPGVHRLRGQPLVDLPVRCVARRARSIAVQTAATSSGVVRSPCHRGSNASWSAKARSTRLYRSGST